MTKKATKKVEAGTELAVRENKAMAVKVSANLPAYLKDYKGALGTEGIENQDVTIPRIKVGQSMSDEVKNESLKEGTLFLNITGEVLALPGAPLRFVPIARAKEYILWRPRKDNGGGILARAKPVKTPEGVRYAWDKPNSTFEVKIEGKTKVTWKIGKYADDQSMVYEYTDEDGKKKKARIAPTEWGSEIPGDKDSGIAATVHHNYVVMLPDFEDMLAALSLSRTAVGPAKDFNAQLKRVAAPMFSRVFTVQSVDDQRDDDKFKNWKFLPAGYADGADFDNTYRPAAEGFSGKSINVDHSDGAEGEETDTSDERL